MVLAVNLWGGMAGASESQGEKLLVKRTGDEKDPTKRIELLDEALKNQSLKGRVLATIFFERGMAHKALKDYFKAIQDFDSALAHSRSAFHAMLEKADCLIELDQLDEASMAIELFLLTKPGTAKAYVLKGRVFEKEGYLGKAEDEYTNFSSWSLVQPWLWN